MNNDIITKEIQFWDNEISKLNGTKSVIYEIAFFKIFVKLEVFLSNLFVYYSTGNESDRGYKPSRKLEFEDEKHLKAVLKNSNSSYVNYLDKIKSLSKHIFDNEKDPFGLIFSDAGYSGYYNKMQILRNYIAHESEESKNKYIREVLNNKSFIEPYKHLFSTNRKNSKTFYSIYIEKITEITEILIEPQDFLSEYTAT